MTSIHKEVRKAKKNLLRIDKHLGWPDTEEGIKRLVGEMTDTERTVCLVGRFIKTYKGWNLMFPSTVDVIFALEGKKEIPKELKFVEDEER